MAEVRTRVHANHKAVGLTGSALQLMLGVLELDAKWLDMYEALQRRRTRGAKGSGGPQNLQGKDDLADVGASQSKANR